MAEHALEAVDTVSDWEYKVTYGPTGQISISNDSVLVSGDRWACRCGYPGPNSFTFDRTGENLLKRLVEAHVASYG